MVITDDKSIACIVASKFNLNIIDKEAMRIVDDRTSIYQKKGSLP